MTAEVVVYNEISNEMFYSCKLESAIVQAISCNQNKICVYTKALPGLEPGFWE